MCVSVCVYVRVHTCVYVYILCTYVCMYLWLSRQVPDDWSIPHKLSISLEHVHITV